MTKKMDIFNPRKCITWAYYSPKIKHLTASTWKIYRTFIGKLAQWKMDRYH